MGRSRSRERSRSRRKDSSKDKRRDTKRSRSRSPRDTRDHDRGSERDRGDRESHRDRDNRRYSTSSRGDYRSERDRSERDRDSSRRYRDGGRERRDKRKVSSSSRRGGGSSKSRSPKRSRTDSSRDKQSKQEDKGSSSNGVNNVSKDANTPRRPLTAPVEGLETIAAKFQEEESQKIKPTFLTKKQRQELALKRLEEQRKAEKDKFEEDKKVREQFNKEAQIAHQQSMRDRDRDGHHRSQYDRDRDRRFRQESRDKREEERKKLKVEETKNKEMQEIKDQYLTKKKKKKKVVPPSQKFKFSFDWEATDDTSQDLNPLYNSKHDVTLMYGRGFMAGVDRGYQRKDKGNVWNKDQDVEIRNKDAREEFEKKHAVREKADKKKKDRLALSNRHWKDKDLEEMVDRDWRIFKEDYNISTRGAGLPNPIRFWSESGLPKLILDALKEAKYTDPTPIQRMGIPIGLANRDVVGIAETGSGKTCAFLLPMLVYISNLPPMTQQSAMDGPYALILAPTRELAQQIEHECQKFSHRMGIRSVPIVGGVAIEEQAFQLRDGAEILIATPGRLNDCLERRYIVLNQCNYIVLDEADRMMDMGFEPQVLSILEAMPATNLRPENPEDQQESHHYRQTIMFSATMPLKVEFLAKKYLRNPAFIAIGDRSGQTADRVKQNIVFVSDPQKRKKLGEMLSYLKPPVMVFCNIKRTCDQISKFLNTQGFNTSSLHGGKMQERREQALAAFKDGSIDVLICTNVAGRGIDVKGITMVINYDMPKSIEDYTHRIGRTGRAGAEGEATSFMTKDDTDIMYDLKKLLLATGNRVPHELATNEAALTKPGSLKKKKPSIVFAKK